MENQALERRRFVWRLVAIPVAIVSVASVLAAREGAWRWSGSYGDDAVELLILGDIQVQQRQGPASAFVNLRETLREADLVYANLEGTLVESRGPSVDIPDKKGWIHPGPQGALALRPNNIDVVGVANNVAYGRANIMKTLEALDAEGVRHAGAGRNIDEAHAPAIVERKGVRFGFLQYTARWHREDEQIATESAPGVARIKSVDGSTIDPGDLERLREDVRALRSKVDIVVVSHHNRDGGTPVQFGAEQQRQRPGAPHPDRTHREEYQREFAHEALDSGADLVFGHGTHTVQGVEIYKGKPILYAVGHSAFDQPGYEKSTDGLVVRAVVKNKSIVRVSFVPVTRNERNDVVMLDPSSGEGARLLALVEGVSGRTPLRVEGQEVVLLEAPATPTDN
jgi:poly-gamma-glutamate capsule biosynthesis protein CapA/YwtB (metallophosphatase superfamily)